MQRAMAAISVWTVQMWLEICVLFNWPGCRSIALQLEPFVPIEVLALDDVQAFALQQTPQHAATSVSSGRHVELKKNATQAATCGHSIPAAVGVRKPASNGTGAVIDFGF